MSRTAGVTLPRLPTSHVRLTSPGAVQPQSAGVKGESARRRALSEPNYTAYVGTPRQDLPHHVYHDAAMFDDVFDKEGKLLVGRTTPKITSPLHTIGYSSLHDPHCRRLFLNNRKLRGHLINLGLITEDLKVVASTREQRQKIRAHELLERKEQLLQTLDERERLRLDRLQRQFNVPRRYRESLAQQDSRRARAEMIQRMKEERAAQAEREQQALQQRQREEKKTKLKRVMEEARLLEQAKRNAARAQQELAEMVAYEKQYGKFGHQLAKWHRESDRIHNRMILMEHNHWSKMRQQQWLSKSFPRRSSRQSSESSVVDVVSVPALQRATHKPEEQKREEEASETADEQGDTQEQGTGENGVQDGEKVRDSKEDGTPTAEDPGETRVPRDTSPEAGLGEREFTLDTPAGTVTTEALTPPTSEAQRAEPEQKEPEAEEGEGDKPEEPEGGGEASQLESLPIAVATAGEPVVLDYDQSSQELVRIMVETFRSLDYSQTGFLSAEDFIQVLSSRDLGLQLDENELLYIVGQVDIYGNGWIPFVQVAPVLPALLQTIYTQRAQLAMEQYGGYMEDQWCQIYLPGGEGQVCYFHKLNGTMQFGRPDDFRPSLKDEVFEDSIADFFETADVNRDGVIEYTDLYNLLVSPMVSTRIYSNQMEQLLQLFQAYAVDGRMALEEFTPVAKILLLMVYQNAYPDVEEWIELESRKCGPFWFNKVSGEVHIPPQHTEQPVSGQTGDTRAEETVGGTAGEASGLEGTQPQPKTRKKRRHHRRKSAEDSTAASPNPPSQSGPPPLQKRSSRSRGSSRKGAERGETAEDKLTTEPEAEVKPQEAVPRERESDDRELTELAGKFSVHVAIPEEEDETAKAAADIESEPVPSAAKDDGEKDELQAAGSMDKLEGRPGVGHNEEPQKTN